MLATLRGMELIKTVMGKTGQMANPAILMMVVKTPLPMLKAQERHVRTV